MKENFHYNVIFKPEPEGGFTVITPSLPGCVSYGKNFEEAVSMIKDAMRGYLAVAKKEGLLIPEEIEENASSTGIGLTF